VKEPARLGAVEESDARDGRSVKRSCGKTSEPGTRGGRALETDGRDSDPPLDNVMGRGARLDEEDDEDAAVLGER
jgi:hypothetical protein